TVQGLAAATVADGAEMARRSIPPSESEGPNGTVWPRRVWLVTGGCGFIGSHLVDELVERGDEVRVLDDLSTGRFENLNTRAQLLRGDVADRDAVGAAMQGISGCFHLAAVASVERASREWLECHRTNLTGTIAILDAARGYGVPVVYASSAAVYGPGRKP